MKNKIRYFRWLGEERPFYTKVLIAREVDAIHILFNGDRITRDRINNIDRFAKDNEWKEVPESEAALII